MNSQYSYIWILAGLISATAMAAPQKKLDIVDPNAHEQIKIELPAREPRPELLKDPQSGAIALSLSSWFPQSISIRSRVPGTSTPEPTGFPSFFVGYITTPFVQNTFISLRGAFGIGLALMEREGSVKFENTTYVDHQKIYALPVSLGVDLSSPYTTYEGFQGLMRLSADPTFVLSENSGLDSGGSQFGAAFEGLLGIRLNLDWLWKTVTRSSDAYARNAISLEAAGVITAGDVNDVDLSGYGARVGITVPL